MKKFADNYQKHTADMLYLQILRAIQVLAGLTATVFLTRLLTPTQFGNYHFVLAFLGLTAVFSLTEMSGTITQSLARGYTATYKGATKVCFKMSFIGSLLAIAGGMYYHSQDKYQLAYSFLLAALFIPFSYGLLTWQGFLAGKEQFFLRVILESINTILMYTGVIIAVSYYPGNIILPVISVFGVPAVFNLLCTLWFLREIPTETKTEPGALRYGLKASIYNVFSVIAQNIDKLLLFMLSPIEVAFYAAIFRIDDLLKKILSDIGTVLSPRFAQYTHYTKRLDLSFKLFALLASVIIIIFAFTLLPMLLVFIYGEAYSVAIPYAQAFLCSLPILTLPSLQISFLLSHLDARNLRNFVMTCSISKIITSFIAINIWGLWGAVVSIYVFRIVSLLYARQIFKHGYTPKFPKSNHDK